MEDVFKKPQDGCVCVCVHRLAKKKSESHVYSVRERRERASCMGMSGRAKAVGT